MLEAITEQLVVLFESLGILGVFVFTVIESFFPPIPSEIVLLTGGFYASQHGGVVTLIAVCIAASLGNFVGTLPFYLISKYSADNLLPKFLNRFGRYLLISNEDLEKSRKYFEKHGRITVFVARLIPGIRSLIAFPAGLSKMDFKMYTMFTLAGSFLWNLIFAGVGYIAYERKDELFQIVEPIGDVILLLIVIATVIYVLRVVWQIVRG